MKIYQIHEYGGEWEDSYDYIKGTYFRKERAAEEMEKMKQKYEEREELAKICDKCPLTEYYDIYMKEEIAEMAAKYCERFQRKDDKYCVNCENYTSGEFYDKHFKIKEVQVLR